MSMLLYHRKFKLVSRKYSFNCTLWYFYFYKNVVMIKRYFHILNKSETKFAVRAQISQRLKGSTKLQLVKIVHPLVQVSSKHRSCTGRPVTSRNSCYPARPPPPIHTHNQDIRYKHSLPNRSLFNLLLTISDCGNPVEVGYSFTGGTGGTTLGGTFNVTCATGYEGTPTPGTVSCLASGLWDSVSGCTIISMGSFFSMAV